MSREYTQERRVAAAIVIGLAVASLGAACAKQAEEGLAEPQPPVAASASVDKAVATTGDVITYTVVVDHDAKIKVDLPEAGAEIAGFRIIDTGTEPAVTKKGRTTFKRWYQLRADLVGSYILPPVTLSYREPGAVLPASPPRGPEQPTTVEDAPSPNDEGAAGGVDGIKTLSTSEIFVEVKSVLPKDGEAKDIRDLKPLIVPKRPVWPWIAGAAGLVVVGAGIAALVWYRRRRRTVVVPPPPPHEVAYAALDALRTTDFASPEAVRQYFFALSEILRAYLEGRFQLNATDLTTEEILPRLADLPLLSTDQRHSLKEFLAGTDLVKYAQHEPSKQEIETAYDRALTFVEATAERPAPTGGAS